MVNGLYLMWSRVSLLSFTHWRRPRATVGVSGPCQQGPIFLHSLLWRFLGYNIFLIYSSICSQVSQKSTLALLSPACSAYHDNKPCHFLFPHFLYQTERRLDWQPFLQSVVSLWWSLVVSKTSYWFNQFYSHFPNSSLLAAIKLNLLAQRS